MNRQKRRTTPQQLDSRSPDVRQFVQQCGIAAHPVSIRLVGANLSDVQIQIERLLGLYGERIRMTSPRLTTSGTTWVAYGTILA